MEPKSLDVVAIAPPPPEHRRRRDAMAAKAGEKRTRYSLPEAIDSPSPVGFRQRVPLTVTEAQQALALLALPRPSAFVPSAPPTEQALFEEVSLGILSARQSTNFRGQRETVVGPEESARVAALLAQLDGAEAAALSDASHTHLVACRPYRTPFTMLLTLIGHKPIWSLPQTIARAARKRVLLEDDIPTIGYLTELHAGILADAMERAAVVASEGTRLANVFSAPFVGAMRSRNRKVIRELERLAGLSLADRTAGWRLALVAQVGAVPSDERIDMPRQTARKVGANLLAFRSERIQPGVNQEPAAPQEYQVRQPMDVPEELTVQCGRAAYNAFAHWMRCDRDDAKRLLLLDRIDVLTPAGKERLRAVRQELADISDQTIDAIPSWADLPTLRAFSRNAARGKKAFALAGQRIYITGLDRAEIRAAGMDWEASIRAVGAAAARSALYAELMGVTGLPDDCDLLAGICLMAGPVNQNDIGKTFFDYDDLLAKTFPRLDPTSLLVWTLKAKTVADPIGNEEQLLNAAQKGALVDLRPGPHEVVSVRKSDGSAEPMRKVAGVVNAERAFADVGNLIEAIPGNAGIAWGAAPGPW